MAAQPTPESTLHLLHRLAQKPGVQSTLILDRSTGAIVRTSGLVSRTDTSNPEATLPPSSPANPSATPATGTGDIGSPASPANGTGTENRARSTSLVGGEVDGTDARAGGLRSAEDVARMVWGFFSSAGQLVDEMMGEGTDEVRLVRLRMRRNELVVVPDAKFLLVVVHDTPVA